MNRFIVVIIINILFSSFLFSQFKFNIIPGGGIHTLAISTQKFSIKEANGRDSIVLAYRDADYGFHFGGAFRFQWLNFLIQPEIVFNSNKTNYTIHDSRNLFIDSLRSEKFQYLDIPLMIGLKLGIIRLNGGPVAHILINSNSELTNLDGFETKFKTATYGYQLGLGFDLSIFTIDIRHEGNFTKYGEHIFLFGENLKFSKSPTRLIATLGFKF
ncbi:MAG: PorT family protein [Bacteroidota bacterium]|nr:PorT family protein [Bacteroidota bacterium]